MTWLVVLIHARGTNCSSFVSRADRSPLLPPLQIADFPRVDSLAEPTLSPGTWPTFFLVLDMNGLLCDSDSGGAGDIRWRNNLRSFLNFCFAQFEVVFWSACGKKKLARYKNGLQDITRVIRRSDRIFGQEMCVVSKYRDPSNPDKPIFLKPLAMLFKNCPEANESNTLLIDDSPDKSCMNDPRNSIHPFTYRSGEPNTIRNPWLLWR